MMETFECPSCGGPNEAAPGASRMACTYCGANLNIPEHLRVAAKVPARVKPAKARPAPCLEKEAPDLLRNVQPLATRAWNTYAAWTWLRWLIPGCLTMLVLGVMACALLGALPFLLGR